MTNETVLTTLPGSRDGERLLVVLAQNRSGKSKVVLRQQNWDDGIGWYDQKSLAIEPHQLRQLRAVLGVSSALTQQGEPEPPATIPFPGVRVESA